MLTDDECCARILTALGICLEDYEFPYPVSFQPLTNDLQPVTSFAYRVVARDRIGSGKSSEPDHPLQLPPARRSHHRPA